MVEGDGFDVGNSVVTAAIKKNEKKTCDCQEKAKGDSGNDDERGGNGGGY